MIKNIFSNLGNVLTGRKVDDEAEIEPTEAELKAERMKFHREQVRNGPVNFRHVTSGQVRRAQERAKAREMKRNFKREVSSYFERQRVAATVRGHLKIAGVIPFIDGHEAELHEQIVSTGWLLQRFGVEVKVDGTGTGRISFAAGDVIDGLRNALSFYNNATGSRYQFPEGYVPALVLELGDEVEDFPAEANA